MDYNQRYSRQTMLSEIGEEGQRKLQEAKVLIVGVGGLGSPIALYLAATGIGTIGLVDPDVVSLSNLQRQILYKEEEVGQPKVQFAQKHIAELNSQTTIHTYPCSFDPTNALSIAKDYEIIVDGCDNFATRYIMDEVAQQLHIPYVFGSIGEFSGMLSVFNYKGGKRFQDLFPKEVTQETSNLPKGVLGPVPGVIGSLEALEVIKIITGCGDVLSNKLFTIDLLTLQNHILQL